MPLPQLVIILIAIGIVLVLVLREMKNRSDDAD